MLDGNDMLEARKQQYLKGKYSLLCQEAQKQYTDQGDREWLSRFESYLDDSNYCIRGEDGLQKWLIDNGQILSL